MKNKFRFYLVLIIKYIVLIVIFPFVLLVSIYDLFTDKDFTIKTTLSNYKSYFLIPFKK